MYRVKLTVVKKDVFLDLTEKYSRRKNGEPITQPCGGWEGGYKVGQSWISQDAEKPQGFCEDAWRTVYQFVFALANGAPTLYNGERTVRPDIAITNCNDGLRPVYFKIERED